MAEAVTLETGTKLERGVRLPPLEGARNLRDLGGYRTTDGRRLRWGRLYRSGTLSGLTGGGRAAFHALGIRTICDFRSTGEQVAEPYDWCQAAGIAYWSRDYPSSFAELHRLIASGLPTGEEAREAMLAGYRELPWRQAPAYAELFRRIAAGDLPLLFNCSAGKDRAGTGAALVLGALGVPRETVVEDYVLTNSAWDYRTALAGMSRDGMMAQASVEVAKAIFTADPAYITAALDAIDRRHGSLAAYVADALGVGPEALKAIRTNLLEQAGHE